MADPVVIWGAGAVGGTIAAYWARAGVDVLIVDADAEHVQACNDGLSIEGPVEAFSVTMRAVTPDAVRGRFSRVVLAVKAHYTAGAISELVPHLDDDGFVLSAQNGLNEIIISKHVGEHRTMGAFVNFGADLLAPGRIMFGNRGAVVVGEIDGQTRPRTRAMHELLALFEPDAVLTDNIHGYLWGKLAYGAMLFATELNMDSMADNFADPDRFPVWRALGREVIATARAHGVTPIGFNAFDPAAFDPTAAADSAGSAASMGEERARASIAGLVAFNRGSAKTHSGVWRDLAIRKRRTEVDAQIAIIADIAADAGMETPAIRRLVELVHDIEEGRRAQSMDTFNQLLAICS